MEADLIERKTAMHQNKELYQDLDRILLTKDEIAAKIRELGQQITKDYQGKKPVLVCILKGASVFFADLIREIDLPLTLDFMAISSYGSATKTSGVVRILKDLDNDILGKDVMNPLEGYLYADTYYVTSGSDTIEGFTEMCLDRMDTELSARKEQIEASGFSVHEFLTLTSIVTKEATSKDQAAVAGVFMNRLAEGMSLGSDVTVGYIFDIDRVELKQSQLDSDNPYNTRKFAGLPPGPISTVIGDAMDAVLNYEKSDDLYFFADENGTVHFFKNQSDFEQGIEDIGLLKDDPEDTAE